MADELSPWLPNGDLSTLGQVLDGAARRIADIAIERHGLVGKEAEHARPLAMLAVLDGLARWPVGVTQRYVMEDLRPAGITWPSIAAATDRAADPAKIRLDRTTAARVTAWRERIAQSPVENTAHADELRPSEMQ